MYVYVLDKDGHPLMPTQRCGHVRWLLKKGRAKVAIRKPFTIRLLYDTLGKTQPLFGGTDPGRTNIGEAVLNQKGEVVYAAHVSTDNKNVAKRMKERAAHRRASRQGERKARQRLAKKHGTQMDPPVQERILPGCQEPIILHGIRNSEARFANRKRPAGWLTPTATHLVRTHMGMVQKICAILPVTDWTLEINKFAFMRMEDGSVRGVDFQNGRMKGYANAKEYIKAVQNGKCGLCGATIDHVHHIMPKSEGGSDGPENLVGLCASCHARIHARDKAAKVQLADIGKKKKYAALSVLNQAVPYIHDGLTAMFGEDHVHGCYGWQTKEYREDRGIQKTHAADAACIAALGADLPWVTPASIPFEVRQFRSHDRALINHQTERTYQKRMPVLENGKPKKDETGRPQLQWVTIAKNRKRRTEQKDPSLEDYIEFLAPKDRTRVVSQIVNSDKMADKDIQNLPAGSIKVVASHRYRNTAGRVMPGTVFLHEGKRYVMTGQTTRGKYLRAAGQKERSFPLRNCQILGRGGLLYL